MRICGYSTVCHPVLMGMKIKQLLDRDLGADLRSVIAVVSTVLAALMIASEELGKVGPTAALTLPVILTIVGRWTQLGNVKPSED